MEQEQKNFPRYVPEHPLPDEIRKMEKDDTVCQFCGVSYLIHSEMKALEERVKEAEKQMEYYKGSVEREQQLKVTLRRVEEEKEKLSGALQASEETSKILSSDIMSKTEQIERLKSENKDIDEKWMKCMGEKEQLERKFQQLSSLGTKAQAQFTAQRIELNEVKQTVREQNKDLSDMSRVVGGKIAEVCEHFTARIQDSEAKLGKV